MKIAQVSPLFESVPPHFYGGTERVVSYLTESLVEMGHDVTLFATGDSITKANLISVAPRGLRLSGSIDPYALHILQLQRVVEMAGQFDIIHFHTDYWHFPVSIRSAYTHITTLHGRLDIPDLYPLYNTFNNMPVVSISYAQRKPLPQACWVGNVYHGMPENLYSFGEGKGEYALFIGRISPEKRVDRAIEIAGRAGLPIKIAAKIDAGDEEYFKTEVKHLLKLPHVENLGEVGEKEKNDLLGNAKVILFPIDWPEPFGMVMIEALATGTPVLAYNRGSVPEIIEHGKTGFIVSSKEEAVKAVKNIDVIKRMDCRQTFLNRFESRAMTNNYLKLYEKMNAENKQIRLHQKSEKTKGSALENVLFG